MHPTVNIIKAIAMLYNLLAKSVLVLYGIPGEHKQCQLSLLLMFISSRLPHHSLYTYSLYFLTDPIRLLNILELVIYVSIYYP